MCAYVCVCVCVRVCVAADGYAVSGSEESAGETHSQAERTGVCVGNGSSGLVYFCLHACSLLLLCTPAVYGVLGVNSILIIIIITINYHYCYY